MFKMKLSLLFIFLVSLLPLRAQEDSILIIIGNSEVTLGEFEWMYGKSISENSGQKQSKEEYLENFIDFKLKINAAMESGLKTQSSFVDELNRYKQQIFNAHLPEQMSIENLIKEAYDRSKIDVSTSHILVRVNEDASPLDTVAAYKKVLMIRNRILSGEDFGKLAREFSDDSNVEENGGYLNFITAFTLEYPVETAAHNTKFNEVSLPCRSNLGYHLVIPHTRRPAYGKVKTIHIIARAAVDDSPEIIASAGIKIEQAYKELLNGRDIYKISLDFNDDSTFLSYRQETPLFGVGEMSAEFEKQAFSIQEINGFSAPFRTAVGWNIIQLLEKENIGPLTKEKKEEIKKKVINGRRLQYHQKKYESRIRNKYSFQEYHTSMGKFYSSVNNSLLKGQWSDERLRNDKEVLFSLESEDHSISEFDSFVEKNQNSNHRYRRAKDYLDDLYLQFKYEIFISFERSALIKQQPEIKHLLNEFSDGILLFEIMDREVWSRAVQDTTGLRNYFEENRDSYMWDTRNDAFIITCSKDTKIKKIRKKYKKIQDGSYDTSILNEKFCTNDSIQCITISRVLAEKGIYEKVDAQQGLAGPGPIYSSTNTNGFVIINERRSPEPKSLDEIRGQVVADYQIYLEDLWMKTLRQKYTVHVNKYLLN